MKKQVLMIGGTGTISTPISKRLAQDPTIELYILNRGNHPEYLPKTAISLIGDMNNTKQIAQLLAPYHFDAVMNFIIMSPTQAQENIDLFQGKCKQFIFISTNCVLDHEHQCIIDENSSYGNTYSLYGQSKAACEQLFLKAYRKVGFPITIVRPTQTYSNQRIPLSVKGKGCWAVVKRMIEGKEVIVHGDGQSLWASTHADDFAKGFVPLVANPKTIGECYQIMNPHPHTWDQLYQTLAELLHVDYHPVYISTEILRHSHSYHFESSIQGDKRWSNLFDMTKLKTIVPEFTCEIDLKEGLKRFLAYMDAHPECKVEEPEFDAWCDAMIVKYHQLVEEMIKTL